MIPLGWAVDTTGAARLMAEALLALGPGGSAVAGVSVILLLGVIITPFVNNAATALVLAPVALALSAAGNLPPQPFLIAVALGASIDFLTPFGHHNNTLIMGLGNYRFADFLKAGWPLMLMSMILGLAAISIRWL